MATARTTNKALSNASSGSDLVNYFSGCGTYRNRDQSAVDADMTKIFDQDPDRALRLLFGVRLITRTPEGMDVVQSGMGSRDEFNKGIIWLHHNNPELLYKNLHLIPVFGCWKDLLQPPLLNTLDQSKILEVIKKGIDDQDQLLMKFLPQNRKGSKIRKDKNSKIGLKSRDQIRSDFAEKIRVYMGWSPKEYRKQKASGGAHLWQKQMSAQEWDKIDFNQIPGMAMLRHNTRTGKDGNNVFARHGLEDKLLEWTLSKETINFVGYPYELVTEIRKVTGNSSQDKLKIAILEKQFEKLLSMCDFSSLGNTCVALDTSGSMSSQAIPGISALDIAVSLGLVFSSATTGYFKNQFVKFDRTSTMCLLKGTLADKVRQMYGANAMGNTNFFSIAEMLVNLRKMFPSIPVEEYPSTFIVLSDMQFDPVSKIPNYNSYRNPDVPRDLDAEKTNFQAVKDKLAEVGLENIRFIWWRVVAPIGGTASVKEFPVVSEDSGNIIVSGFNPIMLNSLLGTTKTITKTEEKSGQADGTETSVKISVATPDDALNNFLSQSIFDKLTI